MKTAFCTLLAGLYSFQFYYGNQGCSLNCKNNTCDESQNCTEGCNEGYWGTACTLECSSTCFRQACNQTVGKCIYGCIQGRYGDTCERRCSSQCLENGCYQNGNCVKGCVQNWAGNQCDQCISTHYGSNCSQSCSVNCVQSACTNETGVCTYGCKTGFYGDMCNSECRRCPQGCDREMGNCSEHCPVGRFGELCERTCNKGCVNGCAKSSGTCNSCVVGRCGDFCNESCYIFDKCQYNSSKLEELEDRNSRNISIIKTVIAFLCISLFIHGCSIIWILRQRVCKTREKKQKTKNDKSASNERPGMYDTVGENGGYQELGYVSGPSHYDRL